MFPEPSGILRHGGQGVVLSFVDGANLKYTDPEVDGKEAVGVRPSSRFSRPPGPCRCGETDPAQFDVADKKTGRPYNECKICRKAKRQAKCGNSSPAVANGPSLMASVSGCKTPEVLIEPKQQEPVLQPRREGGTASGTVAIPERVIEPKSDIAPNISDSKDSIPERIIEPTQPQPERVIEPRKTADLPGKSEVDYSMWERGYGRVLTDDERRQIKFRMTEFFKLLISEDAKAGGYGNDSKEK